MRGLILFGHGSRDPQWSAPIEAVARRAAELAAETEPPTQVACAYLELTRPDLPECVAKLVGAGVTDIEIVPMFIGQGRHAREDLPRLVYDLQKQYPKVHFELRTAIGEDPRAVEWLARFAIE